MKHITIDKEQKIFYLFMIMTIFVSFLYVSIVFNQGMPFAEGWYTYYAQCINSGAIPYKDFEYLFSPIYIYLIAFITRIFGYEIIILRTLGILFFCVITLGTYLIVAEVVGKKNCWIACIASTSAVFYLQSEVVQIFYDYIRLMDIFAIFTVYFLIRYVKAIQQNKKYYGLLLLCGSCNALFSNVKQNMGLIFFAYVLVLIIFLGLYFQKSYKLIIKDLLLYISPSIVITGLIYLFLAFNGSLGSYLTSTGTGAISAKGGIGAILFNWIFNNINAFSSGFSEAMCIFLFISFIYIYNLYRKKHKTENKVETEKLNLVTGILFAVIVSVVVLLCKFNKQFATSILPESYFSPYTLFLIIFSIFILFGIFMLKDILCHTRSMDCQVTFFVLSGAYFAISYGCGTSGGLAEGQATIGIALLIAMSLFFLCDKWQNIIKIGVISLCVIFTVEVADKKMIYTYNWWGMDESDLWSSTATTDIPLLNGIGMSLETKEVYEQVYNAIAENTDESDQIFCFPQIPIFYSICNRMDPGTTSKVQWFDVSTDPVVLNDIEILKNNMPKAIIMYNTSEYAYESHEKLFRKGNISATKVMREFLYNFVYENNYTYYGRYVANNNTIQLWILEENSESLSKKIFSGGEGTYENPYLIENAYQLKNFANMVNDGRTFEGCYIQQIADIDLSVLDESWIPIGKFDSGCYFYGTYNGNGHIIKNLYTTDKGDNSGLFGQLGGCVYNLGVEFGLINGSCCGGIASHSIGSNAKIVNCYTNISINAFRAGGIADNFGGQIINCFSTGNLNGTETANVVSYNSSHVENVFVDLQKIHCAYIKPALYNTNITYCNNNLNSDQTVNSLNAKVDDMNNQTHDEQIKLIHWKVGKAYPTFQTN